jgi:hypothetical protein
MTFCFCVRAQTGRAGERHRSATRRDGDGSIAGPTRTERVPSMRNALLGWPIDPTRAMALVALGPARPWTSIIISTHFHFLFEKLEDHFLVMSCHVI